MASEQYSFGLKGLWSSLANMTAVGLVCVLFYQNHNETLRSCREEREMFRTELRQLHDDSQHQWESMQELGGSVRSLVEDVRQIQIEIREIRKREMQPNPPH